MQILCACVWEKKASEAEWINKNKAFWSISSSGAGHDKQDDRQWEAVSWLSVSSGIIARHSIWVVNPLHLVREITESRDTGGESWSEHTPGWDLGSESLSLLHFCLSAPLYQFLCCSLFSLNHLSLPPPADMDNREVQISDCWHRSDIKAVQSLLCLGWSERDWRDTGSDTQTIHAQTLYPNTIKGTKTI